jgi:hypothetical protein
MVFHIIVVHLLLISEQACYMGVKCLSIFFMTIQS